MRWDVFKRCLPAAAFVKRNGAVFIPISPPVGKPFLSRAAGVAFLSRGRSDHSDSAASLCCVSGQYVRRSLAAAGTGNSNEKFLPVPAPAKGQGQRQVPHGTEHKQVTAGIFRVLLKANQTSALPVIHSTDMLLFPLCGKAFMPQEKPIQKIHKKSRFKK